MTDEKEWPAKPKLGIDNMVVKLTPAKRKMLADKIKEIPEQDRAKVLKLIAIRQASSKQATVPQEAELLEEKDEK